ncbi:putative pyridoxamine 5'-phosphate oxidase family protein [Hamadaea flava]|uniref:Pyridoxamine 5'-phosphate oxidase family protein n=1 Tax=Hamadaea flava TaxID=1742688 RepID=A0ABV8LMI4_9ACTN|nr:pyridoxamine 5'-phosphate oxidase family protein [Hamadaea flava]MCP2321519.1 putative pyridoxamine 5'-phosphate oxidase family protein [Hamadaea flava]
MSASDELAARARAVIDANRYLTLGTSEPDGRPRVSPVYFTHSGYRDFYWVSSPDARHSKNVANRPDVAIVVFDSTAAVGQGQAVYVGARAEMIADDRLAAACEAAFASVGPGATAFTPDELSGDAGFRLYVAHALTFEVHVPGRDPVYGTGIDRRQAVDFG